jgi:hypothetical protein
VAEDPEQLEREIERTRIKLGQDIDALEEKVNPKKVAHRSVDRAREAAKEKVAPLAATAKEKVAPLAATAKERAAERVGMDPSTADTREVATAVAGDTWSTLLEQTRRNPLAVGAAAFALGVVLGHR